MSEIKYVDPRQLVKLASLAKEKAYCPHSKFRVGAALVTDTDQVFTGCNVEIVNHSGTVCAERTAICKAVSEGHVKFKAVAVIGDTNKYLTPCGMCRQALMEFGRGMTVHCSRNDETYQTYNLNDLLPEAFVPSDLTSQ